MSRFNYSKNSSFDHDSDISDADQNDIAKILQDTDDLDGGIKGVNKSNSFSKTMPSSFNKPTGSIQKNKSFNFDDDTDEIDAIIGKKQQSSSNKPPLSSTMPIPSKPKSGFNFDDTDDFGSDSKQKGSNKSSESPSRSKSLADDLFGKNKEETKQNNSEFKLTDKYLKMGQEATNLTKNDEDFSFGGGYMPSFVSNTPRSGPKRNVSFNDDQFSGDIFSRPKTSAGESTKKDNSGSALMKTMPAMSSKNNDDWNIFGNEKTPSNAAKKTNNEFEFDFDSLLKPKNNNLNKTAPGNINANQQKQNEPDWFGSPSTVNNNKDTSSDLIGLDNSFNNRRRPSTSNENKLVFEKPPIANKIDQNKQLTNTKDSMNSSFADSIENDENKKALNANNSFNNLQPLQFELNQSRQHSKEQDSMLPSDTAEDGWFSNLMNNKKTTKKQITNNLDIVETKNDKQLSDLNNNNSNNLTSSNINLPKSSYYLHDRSSTPGQMEPINQTTNINTNNSRLTNTNNSKNTNNALNSQSLLHNNEHRKFKPIMIENVNYDYNEIQAMLQKIKQLEYENQDLHMQLQHNKAHYELQIQLIQDSCENRIRMMKEDRENSIKHFKEEKEILQNHIDLIEKEKHEMSTVYKRKLDDKQKEFDMEIDKLKKFHREAVDNLKTDHEEAIKRVKYLKETEISAAIAASSHTKTIESVINLIEDNTKNLDNITHKVQMSHMMNLNEQEVQIRNKEEQLKLQEQRLSKQQNDYEKEIRLLNETIQRLENHLAEQSKAVAEERWKGKQQEKKMEAFQEALLNEQRIIMDKLARERSDIERSKDDILIEQKRLMQQIYEEKRKIAEEKANLEAAMAAYKDKLHKDSLNNINIEAEISVSSKRLKDEKSRIEQIKSELKEKEMELKQERLRLEEKKQEIDLKSGKLEQLSMVVNQKFKDAEEMFMRSNREKENNAKLFEQTNNIKLNHDSRLNQIQQQLMVLNERETQINQEKVALYKQRQELEAFKSTLTCNKCKEPVRDFGLLGYTTQSSGYGSAFFNNTAKMNFHSTLLTQANNSDLEDAKLMRQLKIQAIKDKQFINEEKQFIDTLKSNSFISKSFSMNQLNSTFA